MSLLKNNTLLVAAEKKIQQTLTPENREDYLKVVNAGLQLGLSGGKESIIAGIKDSKNPLDDCAKGAINVCLMLMKQSRNTMPVKAMIPASYTLMLNAMSVAERLGLIKADNETITKATHIWTNYLFKILRITPDMLKHFSKKLEGVVSDPANMELINRKAGVVRDANASTPTAAPEV